MDLREEIKRALGADTAAVLSAPKRKDQAFRIKVRAVQMRGQELFQASIYQGTQVFHQNCDADCMAGLLQQWITEDFGQLQLEGCGYSVHVLSSRKGKLTVKSRRKEKPEGKTAPAAHNRQKQYILPEGTPVDFLVDLKVMTPQGKVTAARYDKYRQINRFLEFIRDVLPDLPSGREITVVDFGCGKSYLTFAVYYYLNRLLGLDVRMIGLDLKADVIRECSRLAEKYGYEKLTFCVGDIASYQGASAVDMVMTLHACDTATDYALEKAVRWGARVILSVPCCQHELNRQIACEPLGPVLKYGLLKERMAALLTDGLRAGRLECEGYAVQILEFIDMEHTPKNILIRAVKPAGRPGVAQVAERKSGRLAEKKARLDSCERFLHGDLTLHRLLEGQEMVGLGGREETGPKAGTDEEEGKE